MTSILHHRSYHGGIQDPSSTILEALDQISDDIVDLDQIELLPEKYASIKALDLDCVIFMNNVTFGFNDYVALATLKLARWQAVNFWRRCYDRLSGGRPLSIRRAFRTWRQSG